ncbi:WXG100 family type VII secretion target [Kibdelosporangium phytohabitans]|uniref:Outer membrane channel protein CpnT-like N-terminal domain-containing protein n=1 Tax=Kibdelosporangium phytohabitans TaxID=860235 RepID=A0A0N9HX93_9PSEU|nr:WXG100 family type VII secretion target [Kibdelosporangium phytohabitans]ALG10024.1 hypothetical protein AOZ06_26790 [Kibdelosporangium phytohabitans]MBE1468546.1 uncharacterized protein YukE [Kibdelosporangium phytohabitans]
MTGFAIDAPQLLAHGQGSVRQSENFAGLERLLEQARVSDDCFGPLFFYFKDKYFDSLQECQGMAKQAATYLTHISDTVTQTATAYGATEANNATGLANVGQGVGDKGTLDHAGDKTRKSDYEQASAYGSSWSKASQDVTAQLQDPGSPPEVAFAAFNARMEQLQAVTSPGKALIDNGLGWLISITISPLVEWLLEPAIGDPEQMRSTAKGWENVAKWLEGVADSEVKRSAATAAVWEGEAAEKFRTEMREFGEGARAMSGDIDNLKGVLETAATIFDTFVEICVDSIKEFVLGLIIEWLAALAASWITAGASTAAATVSTTSRLAVLTARLGKRVDKLRDDLKDLVDRLEGFLVALRNGKLPKLIDKIPGGRTFAQNYGKRVPEAVDKLRDLRQTTGVKDMVTGNPITNILSQTGNMKGAKEGVKAAQRGLAEARRTGKGLKDAKDEMKKARDHLNGLSKRNTRSTNNHFGEDATDGEALAQGVTKVALGYLAGGGTTDRTKAIFRGVLDNVPGAAVEWGAGQVYDNAQDPSTAEERKAAQQRGFTTDDGKGGNQ